MRATPVPERTGAFHPSSKVFLFFLFSTHPNKNKHKNKTSIGEKLLLYIFIYLYLFFAMDPFIDDDLLRAWTIFMFLVVFL